MSDALISIRSNLVELIASGDKTVELRSTNLRVEVDQTLWIYSKAPVAAVKVVSSILAVHRFAPATIWKKFGKSVGLAKQEFDEFVGSKEQFTAIEIGQVQLLRTPFSLERLRSIQAGYQPPQLVHYLAADNPIRIALRASRSRN